MESINEMIQSDYFDKGTDFSASQFSKPDYQLWVEHNLPENGIVKQGFKAWVGQLVHDASFNHKEINVIKEFSLTSVFDLEHTIGGSIDRLEYLGSGLWQIADIKTQGMFRAQKAFKEPSESWIIQLSIYRWMLKQYGFNVVRSATIYQYVMGFNKNKVGMEEFNKIEIELLPEEDVEHLIRRKIQVATGHEPASCDCESWSCDYCDYTEHCQRSKK